MHRNEFELVEMVHARRAEVRQSTRRTTVHPATGARPLGARVRRAIGHRFVVIGTALVGPL